MWRTYPRHHREQEQVAQVGLQGSLVQAWLQFWRNSGRPRQASEIVPGRSPAKGAQHLMNDVGTGRVGELDSTEGSRQDKPDLAALVLLVAAHGIEQAIGIEPGDGGRQAEPLEQAAQTQGDVGPDPAQPLGQMTFGDHPGGHGLTVLESPVIAGDRLDRMGDGVAEVKHGSQARFLTLVLSHNLGFKPAAPGDDCPQVLAPAVENRLGPGLPAR